MQYILSHTLRKKTGKLLYKPEYTAQKLIKLKDFQLVMIYTFDVAFWDPYNICWSKTKSESYENSKYS